MTDITMNQLWRIAQGEEWDVCQIGLGIAAQVTGPGEDEEYRQVWDAINSDEGFPDECMMDVGARGPVYRVRPEKRNEMIRNWARVLENMGYHVGGY